MVFKYNGKALSFWLILVAQFTLANAKAVEANSESDGLDDCYLSDGRPYQCKRLQVPLNHEQPDGKKISLFYGIIENEVQNQPLDPIFLLAGGPGQSAIQAFLPLASTFKAMFGNRNVYVVDQRGLGKSTPLGCEAIDSLTLESFPIDPEFVTEKIKNCFQQSEYPPQFFTTDDFIQDLEKVREHEGLEKILLYGGSYGTRVAARYAMLKPEVISHLILEGYAGLDLVLYRHFEKDVRQSLEQVEKRCHADAACKKKYPSIMENFEAIISSLPATIKLRHPTKLTTIDFKLTPDTFFGWAMSFLYSPTTQNILPLALNKARLERDFSIFAGMSANQSPASGIDMMVYYAVACVEDYPGLLPVDTLPELTRAIIKPMSAVCESLPKRSLAPDFRRYQPTKIPTLFISGRSDPVTPPGNVTKVIENFTAAEHVELDYYSHTYSFTLKCARSTVRSFLEGEYENACPADLPTLSIFKTPMGY